MTTQSASAYPFLNLQALQVKPPIKTNSVTNFDPEIIEQDAQNTHILIHPSFPALCEAFFAHKRTHGSKYEKSLYATPEEFTWQDLVRRLIAKRPLVFVSKLLDIIPTETYLRCVLILSNNFRWAGWTTPCSATGP